MNGAPSTEGAMTRVVHHQLKMKAARIARNPDSIDEYEALADMCLIANPAVSTPAVIRWMEESMDALLSQGASTESFRKLRSAYEFLMSIIGGFQGVMRDQIAIAGSIVAPDEGKTERPWADWFSDGNFNALTKPGSEVMLWGRVGGGKTYFVLVLAEKAIKTSTWTFVTNITGIRHKENMPIPNLRFETTLSGVLKIWAMLPVGSRLMLGPDEMESLLGGVHVTKAKVQWNHFRWLLRKLGMCVIGIWHDPEEVTSSVKRDASGKVVWIQKEKEKELTIEWAPWGRPVKETIVDVPALEFLTYNTKGISNFAADVDLGKLIMALGKTQTELETKSVMLQCLNDADYYLTGYVPKELQKEGRENAASAERVVSLKDDLKLLADTLQNRDGFDFALIWKDPTDGSTRMSQAKARNLARQLNDELKANVEHVRMNETTFAGATGFDSKAIESKLGLPEGMAREVARRAADKRWRGPK